jgi:hypothetical protein
MEHLDDDMLDEYLLCRTDEVATAKVEEHLLWCGACRAKATRQELELALIRAAFDEDIQP